MELKKKWGNAAKISGLAALLFTSGCSVRTHTEYEYEGVIDGKLASFITYSDDSWKGTQLHVKDESGKEMTYYVTNKGWQIYWIDIKEPGKEPQGFNKPDVDKEFFAKAQEQFNAYMPKLKEARKNYLLQKLN